MKKLLMLLLAPGFVTVSAHAEVGKDKSAPNCQQVIQSVQEQLKKRTSTDATLPSVDSRPDSSSAQ